MGMSTHVIGFRPPDELFKKYKKVWDACIEANVEIPDHVAGFFGDMEPEENGVEVCIEKAAEHWSDGDMCDGYEVDIRKLPPEVHIIRFYNSY